MDKVLANKYFNFLENWDSLDEETKISSAGQIVDLFKDSYIKDEYNENVIDLYNFYYQIWTKISPEVQHLVSRPLLDSIKSHILEGDIKFKSIEYTGENSFYSNSVSNNEISIIFNAQSEETKKELFETLKQIIPLENCPINLEYREVFNNLMCNIWVDASAETQLKNMEMLEYLLPLAPETYSAYMNQSSKYLKNYTPEEKQEWIRKSEISAKDKYNSMVLKLLRNTKFKLSKEHFKMSLEYENLSEQDADELYSLYEDTFSYSNDINKTLCTNTLRILGNKIDIMSLTRLATCDVDLQENLLNLISSSEAVKEVIINSINSSPYWDSEINAISNNFRSFKDLFENIDSQNIQLSNKDIENLKNITLQKNYFNITNIEELYDYENKKNTICNKILNGEELGNEYRYINFMSQDQREKFAFLELQYGISYEDAMNLVQKYGNDLDKIDEPEFVSTISKIKNLNTILNTDNIAELYRQGNLEEFDKKSNYDLTTLNSECLNLYAKLYQKDFDNHSINSNIDSISQVTYNDASIKVSKISPYRIINGKKIRSEISAFARVEGAYSDWQEPEDFREALDTPNTRYHGNCKSSIRSNSLSIARPNGPIFGYSNCKEDTLKLMAPWDIVSASANTSLAINSMHWNEPYTNGTQFRIPQELTDFTRHGHNEIVSERLIIDGKKFTKDEPDYILFFTEAGETIDLYENLLASNDFEEKLKLIKEKNNNLSAEDYEFLNADRWRISKKAAAQLHKEINVIDKDEFRECEEIRLKQLLDAFENPTKTIDFIEESDFNLSQSELLKKIVVEFENNVAGNQFSRNTGYFTPQNRSEIYDRINKKVISYKRSNPSLYSELSKTMEDVYTTEYHKSFSNVGKPVASQEFKNFYEAKSIEIKTRNEYENDTAIEALDFNETGIQYSSKIKSTIENINNTDFYEGNKHHSIEHIDKVVLFAGILAKNEGLDEKTTDLLLAASAFHDFGRKYLGDNNVNHAMEGAHRIYDYMERNPNNPFGITPDNVKILQTAINYHEHRENPDGELDISAIENLCKFYGVDQKDFDVTCKISELLKDADALDRTRFPERGTLDIRKLRSNTAKKASMISHAKKINEAYAKEILAEEYGFDKSELDGNSSVSVLHDKRLYRSVDEKHIPLSRRLEMIQNTKAYEPELEPEIEKHNGLMKLYDIFSVDKQAVLQAKGFIKRTLDKIKTSFIERS